MSTETTTLSRGYLGWSLPLRHQVGGTLFWGVATGKWQRRARDGCCPRAEWNPSFFFLRLCRGYQWAPGAPREARRSSERLQRVGGSPRQPLAVHSLHAPSHRALPAQDPPASPFHSGGTHPPHADSGWFTAGGTFTLFTHTFQESLTCSALPTCGCDGA